MLVVLSIIFLATALGILVELNRRGLKRERAEQQAWWAKHFDQEKLRYLQLAWRLRFVRLPNESEEQFILRFKSWLAEECWRGTKNG